MRTFLLLIALIMAMIMPASAGDWDLFRFEDFPASMQRARKAPLQLVRGEFSWEFRTRVREAYKDQPDFGGRYVTGSAGCGTECQVNFMIDTKTGKVIVAPVSSAGVEVRLDSNLWIVNPYNEENGPAYSVDPVAYYYLWNGKDFVELGQKEWPKPEVTGSIVPTYGHFSGLTLPNPVVAPAPTAAVLPETARVPTARPLS